MSAESIPADRPQSSMAGNSAGTTTATATVVPPQYVTAPNTALSPDGSPVKIAAEKTETSDIVTSACSEVVTSQPAGVVSIEVGRSHWLSNMSQ